MAAHPLLQPIIAAYQPIPNCSPSLQPIPNCSPSLQPIPYCSPSLQPIRDTASLRAAPARRKHASRPLIAAYCGLLPVIASYCSLLPPKTPPAGALHGCQRGCSAASPLLLHLVAAYCVLLRLIAALPRSGNAVRAPPCGRGAALPARRPTTTMLAAAVAVLLLRAGLGFGV